VHRYVCRTKPVPRGTAPGAQPTSPAAAPRFQTRYQEHSPRPVHTHGVAPPAKHLGAGAPSGSHTRTSPTAGAHLRHHEDVVWQLRPRRE
jgi:hypothetical protein